METGGRVNNDKKDRKDKDDKGHGDSRRGPGAERQRRRAASVRPNVTGIEDWKKRAAARSARAMPYEQKIQLLSTPKKQALLIRFIV
jgi:hypothetical protein